MSRTLRQTPLDCSEKVKGKVRKRGDHRNIKRRDRKLSKAKPKQKTGGAILVTAK